MWMQRHGYQMPGCPRKRAITSASRAGTDVMVSAGARCLGVARAGSTAVNRQRICLGFVSLRASVRPSRAGRGSWPCAQRVEAPHLFRGGNAARIAPATPCQRPRCSLAEPTTGTAARRAEKASPPHPFSTAPGSLIPPSLNPSPGTPARQAVFLHLRPSM